jgi:dimethylglycine catabolism A
LGVTPVRVPVKRLIEQFWSPAMNRRSDGYGGSFANRMRFGLEILEACRKAVGQDFLIGIRVPSVEMLDDGLTHQDCIVIASACAASGLIDFISVVGGTAVDYQASGIPASSWSAIRPNLTNAHG